MASVTDITNVGNSWRFHPDMMNFIMSTGFASGVRRKYYKNEFMYRIFVILC